MGGGRHTGILNLTKPPARQCRVEWGGDGTHTPAAAAAAFHIPIIDGGGDIPVAETLPYQEVLITAVEGDITLWRHLLCEQNGAHKPTRIQREDKP